MTGKLEEVKDALALRGEKLARMEDATAELSDSAANFATLTAALARQQKSGGLSSWLGL